MVATEKREFLADVSLRWREAKPVKCVFNLFFQKSLVDRDLSLGGAGLRSEKIDLSCCVSEREG